MCECPLPAAAEFSRGSVEFLAVVTDAGDQVTGLLLAEAMSLRELTYLIILIGRHAASVRFANFALIVWHFASPSACQDNPYYRRFVPLAAARPRPRFGL
jgi:hypothetical protein